MPRLNNGNFITSVYIQNLCTFAVMFSDSFHLLLLCFVSGFTQCVLLACAAYVYRHHRNYQFRKLFAAVLVMHSVGFFNNFVVSACRDIPFSDFLNTLLIFYDYLIVGAYMMFAVSLVFPDKYSLRQLLVMEVPFLAAMFLFAVTESPLIYPIIQAFTLVASLALMVFLLVSIRKHTAMLRDNVGNMESFDLRWSAVLCILLFVVQLLWAFESVSQLMWFSAQEVNRNLLFDSLYCFVTQGFVLFVTHRIVQQEVFTVASEEQEALLDIPAKNDTVEPNPMSSSACTTYYETFVGKDVDKFVRENKCYLDKSLTVQKLATLLGTNRQYLSSYINKEKQKTFYDYINDFRLEEAKALLDEKTIGRQYSLDEVAGLSGFNSYSTFLRSFAKKYGLTPSKYMKTALDKRVANP